MRRSCSPPPTAARAPASGCTTTWRPTSSARLAGKHLEARLGAVFSTYRYFDHLVSVSPELMRLNRKNLAAHAAPDKFRFALNTINGERVLQMAGLLRADTAGHGESPDTRHRPAPRAVRHHQRGGGGQRADEVLPGQRHRPRGTQPAADQHDGRARQGDDVRHGRPALAGEEPRAPDRRVRASARAGIPTSGW